MTMQNKLNELVWEAVKASVPAGKAILKVYETDFDVETKEDQSPLTKADMESHLCIMKMLEGTQLPILSEEGKTIPYETRKEWDLFWLIDPLDGTKEFVNRNGEFTVNIALIEGNYPVAGVIYIPVSDELYVGIQGSGAFKIDNVSRKIDAYSFDKLISESTKLPAPVKKNKYTVVCSRSHMSAETETYIDELRSVHGELEFASRGSSLKLCMVAEGNADVYPRFAPTMEWDTAAGQAIAECSGATVTQPESGDRLRYNKENLLNPWFIVGR